MPSRWTRSLRSLFLGLLVTVGMSFVASTSLADEPADAAASPAVAASLEARIAYLEQRLYSDLTARVEEKSRRMVERATDRQLSALLDGLDPTLSNIPASYRIVAPL